MTNADFVAELSRGLDWRLDEVRSLKNLIAGASPAERDDLRKSLVVILYAHFEGFCIFALQHYLGALNQIRLPCRQVTAALVAGSWEKLFNAMEHGDEKCRVFSQPLPHDAKLHRHWRRRHFVESIERLYDLPLQVPEDVIDSDSNLKPEVLERNLFVLGLDHTFVNQHAETISKLLGRRNRLAHGEDRRGVPEDEYERYEHAVFEICYTLTEFLKDAHRDSSHERASPFSG